MVRETVAPAAAAPTLLQRIWRFLSRLFYRLFGRLFGRSTPETRPATESEDGIGSEPGSGSQTWPDPGPPP